MAKSPNNPFHSLWFNCSFSFSSPFKTQEKMSSSDDDQPFVKILKAMGIEDFDPLVPVALNEYAARK